MRDRAEEVPNVGFYNLVDAPLLDRPTQFVQTLMLVAPRSIAVAAVLELHFVDGFQHPFDRQFNQLVFKTADPNALP